MCKPTAHTAVRHMDMPWPQCAHVPSLLSTFSFLPSDGDASLPPLYPTLLTIVGTISRHVASKILAPLITTLTSAPASIPQPGLIRQVAPLAHASGQHVGRRQEERGGPVGQRVGHLHQQGVGHAAWVELDVEGGNEGGDGVTAHRRERAHVVVPCIEQLGLFDTTHVPPPTRGGVPGLDVRPSSAEEVNNPAPRDRVMERQIGQHRVCWQTAYDLDDHGYAASRECVEKASGGVRVAARYEA